MQAPNQIGDYHIKRLIGRGGMGVVYLAQDTRIGREVALKVLPYQLAQDEKARLRFEREIELFVRLEHPHIVPTYSVELEGEQPFIVMRYLSSGTLRDRLSREGFETEAFWRAMEQVADALDYAHAQQVVHRDIKPTNILFDDFDNAYVADFGIAKALNDTASGLSTYSLPGTPAYMSPEQFNSTDIDGRSDQYSLAVVTFEALTGQIPFAGDTVRMMYQHVHEPPPAAHELVPHLLPDTSAVLARALSKKPGDRFASAQEFVSAAQKAALGETAASTLPAAAADEPSTAPDAIVSEPPAPPKAPEREVRSKLKHEKAEQSLPSPDSPRQLLKETRSQIVPGAGGHEEAASPRRRLVLLGLVGVAVVLSLAFILFPRIPPPEEVATPEPVSAAPVPASPSPTLTATVLPSATPRPTATQMAENTTGPEASALVMAGRGRWETEDDSGVTETNLQLAYGSNAPLKLVTNATPIELRLSDQITLFLAPEGEAVLSTAQIDDSTVPHIELIGGRLLLITPQSLEVTNPFGARATIQEGVMGVVNSSDAFRFEVDCLEGPCQVYGDLGGEIELEDRRSTVVGGTGVPGPSLAARYELYYQLSDLVPTPTATPSSTPTRTPSPTPTATSTAIPPTREPTPTSTPLVVASPTSPPRPQPAPTNPPPPTAVPPTTVPPEPPTLVPPPTDDGYPYP